MRALGLARPGDKLSLLCLGAHSDDIEIGAGGTILELMASKVQLEVHWCVLSAIGERAKEAEASARAFLAGRIEPTSKSASSKTASSPTREAKSKAGSRTSSRASTLTSFLHTGAEMRIRITARSAS